VVLPRSSVTASTPNCHLPDWCTSRSTSQYRIAIVHHTFFRHFGKEVIGNRTKLSKEDSKVNILWLKLYKVCRLRFVGEPQSTFEPQEFIEAIDGIDNGIMQYPSDIEPMYRNNTDLSKRVGALNPWWNQPTDSQAVDVSLSCFSWYLRHAFS